MAAVIERGALRRRLRAAFPSVTPSARRRSPPASAARTRHHIPAMNWYSRAERRYVEYGSSFRAARRFGVAQQLTDTVYNMNAEHLPRRRADGLRVARRRRTCAPPGRRT